MAKVRHLYLDLDTNGEAKLAAIRSSNTVPIPTAIVSTSAGKYQVLWRVESIPLEQQESLLKVLAFTFGGDPACTDCNRVVRLPGFLNQKYTPAHVVSVEYPSESTSHSEDFKLADPMPNPDVFRVPIEPAKPTGKHSNSEQDWAWILRELASGKDPVKLTRTLTEKRLGKAESRVLRAANRRRRIGVALAEGWPSNRRRRNDAPGSPPVPDSRPALLCPSA